MVEFDQVVRKMRRKVNRCTDGGTTNNRSIGHGEYWYVHIPVPVLALISLFKYASHHEEFYLHRTYNNRVKKIAHAYF